MILHFIRHFPTHLDGICFGISDVAAPFGPDDVTKILSQVPKPQYLFSSPALRCSSLAQALSLAWDCPYSIHQELREINFGHWEGRSWSQIPRSDIDEWARDVWNFRPPQGETPRDVCRRVQIFKQHLRDLNPDSAVIVSHAGIKRVWDLDPDTENPDLTQLLAKIPHGSPILCKNSF